MRANSLLDHLKVHIGNCILMRAEVVSMFLNLRAAIPVAGTP